MKQTGQNPVDFGYTRWVVNTDGGCRDNPGPGAWAFVVRSEHAGDLVHVGSGFLPHTTNNFAEYTGLIEACRYLLARPTPRRILFESDSKLVVEQLNANWKVNSVLAEVFGVAADLYTKLSAKADVSITHVGRELNKLADAECNRVMDLKGIVCSKKGVKRVPKGA